MKKIFLLMLMLIAISVMTGCTAVDEALGKIGEDIEASRLESAGESDRSGMDWSFVPVLREEATKTFTEAFPD